ncbi:MAG: alkaline phosphatase family protein [Chitinophagaceae bacterium]|nr:alkaline phosphatase family protein [Chitinophagaceae bacterium]
MRTLSLLLLILISHFSFSQVKTAKNPVSRPKLVVGIVVDQMRWDYLYRYYDRYAADGGFKRMINRGFSCENTFINYIPTVTACGHTCLFTGSVPAIHGIAGNDWYDRTTGKFVYCAGDSTVNGVGTTRDAGKMSPRNMIVTSIADELKLATNFRSKVVGVAFKDRGAILPAGHIANAAYWYDPETGNFISSTYYMQNLPQWVTEFNSRKYPDQYFKKGWNTLYPIETYTQSTRDDMPWEGKPFGQDQKAFPYKLEKFIGGTSYGTLTATPFGNTLTKQMAMAAVDNEQLGKDSIADFLTVSFSSPDYIGHTFGPNSIESEDGYLRLDKELGELFSFLDKKVGAGQYLVFLSADHGAAHSGGFSMEYNLPGGGFRYERIENGVDSVLQKKYGNYKFLVASDNYQLYISHHLIDSLRLDKKEVFKTATDFLLTLPEVERAFAYEDLQNVPLPEFIAKQAANGYNAKRSGDIQIMLKPGYMHGGYTGTSHGSWNPYDSHIPLLWYGWNVKPGKTNRETHMTDVAPTIAAMLRIQMPSGCVGEVIEEVFK